MGNHLGRLGCIIAVGGALGLGLGCGSKNKKATQDPDEVQGDTSTQVSKIDPTLCEAEGKEVENYDLNSDERADVWKLYKLVQEKGGTSRVLTCKQADLNFDGKKDYVVAFNDAAGIMFEKFDLDFQQGFDAFYKYEEVEGDTAKSLLYEVQRDSNFDGKYDIIEKYDTATSLLAEVQRDTNGDLKPDVWEQFDKGVLVAILYDDDPYDGKVDRREEIATQEDETEKPSVPEGTEPAAEGSGDSLE